MSKLKEIKGRFITNIDLFKDNYVAHLSNPEYEPNLKLYQRDKNNLDQVIKDLFFLRNDMEIKDDTLDKKIKEMFKIIETDKTMHKNLKKELGKLGDGDLAAIKMSEDVDTRYKNLVFTLIVNCLIILIIGRIIYHVVRKDSN
tara:strand:- start:135 stop:563 length:429 start_codon:yes stop_codon:yes gene_type:complete